MGDFQQLRHGQRWSWVSKRRWENSYHGGGWIWFETIWRSSSPPSHGRKTRPWMIPTIYIIHLHAMPSLSSLWLIWHHYHHLSQNIHNLTSYNQILHSPNKSVIGLIPLLSLATQGFSQDWSKCFLNIELSFSKFQFDNKCCWTTQMCQNRYFPFLTPSSYIWNVSKVQRATFDKWIPTSRFDHRCTESLGWRHFVVVGLFLNTI